MRSRSTVSCLLVLALATVSASYLGAAEETTTAPAEPQVAIPTETFATPETEAAPDADPFLDQSVITVTPVHTVYCVCQVGVNCCGDPGGDITCGGSNYCVCNGENKCALLHVHPK